MRWLSHLALDGAPFLLFKVVFSVPSHSIDLSEFMVLAIPDVEINLDAIDILNVWTELEVRTDRSRYSSLTVAMSVPVPVAQGYQILAEPLVNPFNIGQRTR